MRKRERTKWVIAGMVMVTGIIFYLCPDERVVSLLSASFRKFQCRLSCCNYFCSSFQSCEAQSKCPRRKICCPDGSCQVTCHLERDERVSEDFEVENKFTSEDCDGVCDEGEQCVFVTRSCPAHSLLRISKDHPQQHDCPDYFTCVPEREWSIQFSNFTRLLARRFCSTINVLHYSLLLIFRVDHLHQRYVRPGRDLSHAAFAQLFLGTLSPCGKLQLCSSKATYLTVHNRWKKELSVSQHEPFISMDEIYYTCLNCQTYEKKKRNIIVRLLSFIVAFLRGGTKKYGMEEHLEFTSDCRLWKRRKCNEPRTRQGEYFRCTWREL